MPESPEIAVISLFAGRYITFEPYLHYLDNLDYPKEKLHLVWYSNAKSRQFQFLLEHAREERLASYGSITLKFETEIPESTMAFEEGNLRYSKQHGDIIAGLYNEAWKLIPEGIEYVFFMEDDVLIPSHGLKRLLKTLQPDERVAEVAGVMFDRHSPAIFNHNYLFYDDEKSFRAGGQLKRVMGQQPMHQWGIQRIPLNHLGVTLMRKSLIDQLPQPLFQTRHPNPIYKDIIGCDMVLGFKMVEAGMLALVDFDVRGLHMDSKGKIH